jgi:thiamine-monophosphate kinase
MTRKRRLSEVELISSFKRAIDAAGVRPRGLVTGVGDDAAVFRGNADEDFVVTKDVLVEGRHFERDWLGGRDLGRRLAAVNLSDVAAMGARPLYGLFSLVLPPGIDQTYVGRVTKGIVEGLSAHGAALVGGNVSGTGPAGPLTCDLTLIGACPRGRAWLRRARPGDAIIVAGALGDAAAGLELLRSGTATTPVGGRLARAFTRPEPLLDVTAALRGMPGVRGAIDVSDGLSTDLIHVCDASGVGCEVDGDSIPVSRALAAFCKARGIDPVEWIMRGGEDYALVLSVSRRSAMAVERRARSRTGRPINVIGTFTGRKGYYAIVRGGRRARFSASGWDHLGF